MMTDSECGFLAKVSGPAQIAAKLTGVPASVTIAQAILESSVAPKPGQEGGAGWGQSPLAVHANNYFGIKAVPGQDYIEEPTHEWFSGRYEAVQADFARFPTITDGFAAHGRLLNRPRYAKAMLVKADRKKFAHALQACGYSTSPTYGDTLCKLMDQFDLQQYD